MSDLDYVIPDDAEDDVENNETSETIDHVQTGKDRLYVQFKQPNNEKLIEMLMEPIQEVEEMLAVVATHRDVNTAVGTILETVGKKIGQGRISADDEIYRRYIRARVSVNKSKGQLEDVITVTKAVLGPDFVGTVRVEAQYPAGIMVTVVGEIDADTAAILGFLLPKTVSAGIRVQVVYSLSTPAVTFTFDAGPGFDIGHLGGSI